MNTASHPTRRLGVDFSSNANDFELEVAFEARPSETLVLVGPNGAGKSTCVRTLAGLRQIDRGSITCGDSVWDDPSQNTFVQPQDRRIGVVFQDFRLLPHLSVLDNVAAGPRFRGQARNDARRTARGWLDRFSLSSLEGRSPQQLSGGETQRVALVRALASEPSVLLLDEPLSAIDSSERLALRRLLGEVLAAFGGPRILITHDVQDAFALADRIVVLENGHVSQQGSLAQICRAPRSRYAADFVGVNRIEGLVADGRLALEDDAVLVVDPGTPDGLTTVTIHPRAISLFPEPPVGSPRNVFELRVGSIESGLERARIRLNGSLPCVAEVTKESVRQLQLEPGRRIWVAVKATEVHACD
ncbi:MAG: ATP-binding cassette domain-containing protein [Planctomycetota bacterium]